MAGHTEFRFLNCLCLGEHQPCAARAREPYLTGKAVEPRGLVRRQRHALAVRADGHVARAAVDEQHPRRAVDSRFSAR